MIKPEQTTKRKTAAKQTSEVEDEEKAVKSILMIINKKFKSNIRLTDFEKIAVFYRRKQSNYFQSFLIAQRIIPFAILKILYQFFLKKEFIFANIKFFYSRGYEDDEEVIAYGPNIINKRFKGENIFDHYLQNLYFPAVIAKHIPITYRQERINKKGMIEEKNEEEWRESSEKDVFVMFNPAKLIITPNAVYIYNEDARLKQEIYNLLSYHHEIFDKFLDNYKDKCVPHEIYMDWLMKWFPGKIHLQSLQYSV